MAHTGAVPVIHRETGRDVLVLANVGQHPEQLLHGIPAALDEITSRPDPYEEVFPPLLDSLLCNKNV